MEPATPKISIPRDIIFDIFSTLPVKSLMRFKSVSKFCNSLLYESVFVDIHQCRTSRIKFIVRQRAMLYTMEEAIEEGKAMLYTMEAIEEGKASPLPIDNFCEQLFYNHMMCVNGLFCCAMDHVERIAICNPSMKVVRSLPRLKEGPKIDYPQYFYSTGFDPEEKTYKVLMTINEYVKHVNPTRYWVFTLGTDESWREIKGITHFDVTSKNAVCVSGVIYMLSYTEPNIFVLAFDVKSENFRIINLWDSFDPHMGCYYNIIKVSDKLAILDKRNLYGGENMDVWILGNEEWEKHMIEIPQPWRSTQFGWPTFCNTCDKEILFTNRFEPCRFICLCYNVTEKRWRNFEIKGLSEKSSINDIFSYAESLIPVERICNSD